EADSKYSSVAELGPIMSATGSWHNFHGYHPSEAVNRVKFQFDDGGGSQFATSSFEGGRHQYHQRPGSSSVHAGSMTYGGHFQQAGTAMWVLEGQTTGDALRFVGVAGADLYAIQDGCAATSLTLGCEGKNSSGGNGNLISGNFVNFDRN